MDSISHNMDELEANAGSAKVDLAEGRDHADIVSVMLMAFPHLFPQNTNEWKPNVERDPGSDTYAAPEIWAGFADFYKRAGEAAEYPSDPRFVAQRVLTRLEREELPDVGPRRERFVAGAAKDDRAHVGVAVDLLTQVVEIVVHVEGHRVARVGAIERHPRHTLLPFEHQVSGVDRLHRCPPLI